MTARADRGGLNWWRVFEVAACGVGLVVLSPVLALAAIAIWIDDRRPILFRQTRVGKDGVPFRLIKFRTMRIGVAGAKITSAGDRRVTWTGRILRRYKIDEIPQIWNVLRGDMSLVGPRPEVPEYVNYQDPRWRKILARRPGITDLSTLVHCREEETLSRFANPERGYAEVILPEKLALSLEYESLRTFRSDARLLLLTIRYSLRPAGLDPKKNLFPIPSASLAGGSDRTMTEITNHAATALPESVPELPIIRIEPPTGVSINFREMWAYRELLYFLIWRDIKVRYKQTILGVAWAVLQPLLTMVIFSLVFGRLAKMPSDDIPYPVFALAGLVPWLFFANGLNQSSNSLVSNANLITKVYFPRMHIPLASVLSGLVDFFLSGVMLAVMMVVFRVKPNVHMLWLPAFLVLGVVTSLGVGLWLSAMNVKFRDIRYVVPFLVQFWFFATPVVYPSSLLTKPWAKMLYGANPMTGVVEGFRWAMFGKSPPGPMLAVSALVTLVILVSGAYYFRRTERTFADVV